MPTTTALATLEGKAPAQALGEAMEAMDPPPTGVGVFEMEDGSGLWEVGGYFGEAPDAAQLALLEAAFGVSLVVSELPETDWVAHVRRELAPVEAGRFFVYGSHDADRVPEGRIALLIEASMAFGTGHHGTTLGCLRAIDALDEAPASVADLGCGTAVLAMAAARAFPEARVVATDIDPVAIEVAEANLAANDLTGRVQTAVAEGTDHPALAGPFDLVVANILKGPLVALAPDIARIAAPGGRIVLSGILNEQADAVAEAYARSGINELGREVIGDWTTLRLRAKGEIGALNE